MSAWKRLEKRGEKLLAIGQTIRAAYACDHLNFYDGESFVLLTFLPGFNKLVLIAEARDNDHRFKLMIWFGDAISKAKLHMLESLIGYTPEDSSVGATLSCH